MVARALGQPILDQQAFVGAAPSRLLSVRNFDRFAKESLGGCRVWRVGAERDFAADSKQLGSTHRLCARVPAAGSTEVHQLLEQHWAPVGVKRTSVSW